MTYRQKEKKMLYKLGWGLLAALLVYILLQQLAGGTLTRWLPPCIFHEVTGFYCPGCGGTRAFHALLRGQLGQSLLFHPVVLYGGCLYLWFMISNTLEYASGGRWQISMPYRRWYLPVGLGLLAFHFISKNGIMLIGMIP